MDSTHLPSRAKRRKGEREKVVLDVYYFPSSPFSLFALHYLITPFCNKPSISTSLTPSSCNTSRVCWPRVGGAIRTAPGVFLSFTGIPPTFILPTREWLTSTAI